MILGWSLPCCLRACTDAVRTDGYSIIFYSFCQEVFYVRKSTLRERRDDKRKNIHVFVFSGVDKSRAVWYNTSNFLERRPRNEIRPRIVLLLLYCARSPSFRRHPLTKYKRIIGSGLSGGLVVVCGNSALFVFSFTFGRMILHPI